MTDDVWREYFDSGDAQHVGESFTTDNLREAEFPKGVLALPPVAAILDVGSGTGRSTSASGRS